MGYFDSLRSIGNPAPIRRLLPQPPRAPAGCGLGNNSRFLAKGRLVSHAGIVYL